MTERGKRRGREGGRLGFRHGTPPCQAPGIAQMVTRKAPSRRRWRLLVGGAVLAIALAAALGLVRARRAGPEAQWREIEAAIATRHWEEARYRLGVPIATEQKTTIFLCAFVQNP